MPRLLNTLNEKDRIIRSKESWNKFLAKIFLVMMIDR